MLQVLSTFLVPVDLRAIHDDNCTGGSLVVAVQLLDKAKIQLAHFFVGFASLLWDDGIDEVSHRCFAIRDGAEEVAAAAPRGG